MFTLHKIMHWKSNLLIVGVMLCYFEHGKPSHLLATTSWKPTTCIRQLHKDVTTHNMHMGLLELED
jgi:hypothetical protein